MYGTTATPQVVVPTTLISSRQPKLALLVVAAMIQSADKIALTLAELILSGTTAPGMTETQEVVEFLTPKIGQQSKPAVDVVEVTMVKCKARALIYRQTATPGTTRSGLERPQQIQHTQYAVVRFVNHVLKLLNSKAPALTELDLTPLETHAHGMILTQIIVENLIRTIGHHSKPAVHAEEAQILKYKKMECVLKHNSRLIREETIAPGTPRIRSSVVIMTMMTSKLRTAALVKAFLQTMILLNPQTMKLRNLQMLSLQVQPPHRYVVAK